MKTNYVTCYELFCSLNRMGEVDSIKTACAIAQTIENIKDKAVFYDNQRNRLIKKYGKPNDDGQIVIHVTDPEYEAFAKEMDELARMPVDVDIVQVDADISDLQCEGAKVKDYSIVAAFMLRKSEDKEDASRNN